MTLSCGALGPVELAAMCLELVQEGAMQQRPTISCNLLGKNQQGVPFDGLTEQNHSQSPRGLQLAR